MSRQNKQLLRGCALSAVLKFGGSSVKSLARLHHVADVVQSRLSQGPLIVVLSAPGDSTDQLIELANRLCGQPDVRELDQLISTGEQVSISLLGMLLLSRGVKARSITAWQCGIHCDEQYSSARILSIDSTILKTMLAEHDVLVVAGFQGVNSHGDIATLGRGGSDTTAVALAGTLGVACDIYTDVDGIYSADPNRIKRARLHARMPSDSVLALARGGAQVLHHRAVELARHHQVQLRVLNTFAPRNSGTIIETGEFVMERCNKIYGVASQEDVSLVSLRLSKSDADNVAEFLRLLEQNHIDCDLCCFAGNRLDMLVPSAQAGTLVSLCDRLFSATKRLVHGNGAKVCLVGTGLSREAGLQARLIQLLRDHAIDIRYAGCSDNSLNVLLDRSDRLRAEALLHEKFVEEFEQHETGFYQNGCSVLPGNSALSVSP